MCILAAMVTDRQCCLAPRTAEPEDIVFILHGAKVPFVLRVRQNPINLESDETPCEFTLTDGLEYEVVGPCWIPEEMWGHADKEFEENSDSHLFHMVLV